MCAVNRHGAGVESGAQNRKKSWLMTLLKRKKRTRLINPSLWLASGRGPRPLRERRFLHQWPTGISGCIIYVTHNAYCRPIRPEFGRQAFVSSLAQEGLFVILWRLWTQLLLHTGKKQVGVAKFCVCNSSRVHKRQRIMSSSCLISPAGCVGGPFPSRSWEGNSAELAHLQVHLCSLLILWSLPLLLQGLYLSFNASNFEDTRISPAVEKHGKMATMYSIALRYFSIRGLYRLIRD